MPKNEPLIRIALADDHNLVRKSLAQILNGTTGLTVVATAQDGEALRREIALLETPPDICLLDVNMPNGGGYAALLALSNAYPDMRFIILSMLDHEMLVLKMFRAGAAGYILKDQDPEELIQAIWTVAAGGYAFLRETGNRMMRHLRSESAFKELTLTPRQEQFLALTCTDMSYKEIATSMRIDERTVDGYRDALFEKLRVNSRTGLALAALQMGLGNL